MKTFNGLDGQLLYLTELDLKHPVEAAGIGGLAAQIGPGILADWNGLQNGKITLPLPWVLFEPGQVLVKDGAASNVYAVQDFKLWNNEKKGIQSGIQLRFAAPSAWSYYAYSAGTEGLVMRTVGLEAHPDRPVKTDGSALPIRSEEATFILATTIGARDWIGVIVQSLPEGAASASDLVAFNQK